MLKNKVQNKVFYNHHKTQWLIILGVLGLVFILMFLTSAIILDVNNTVSENFINNYKKVIQMFFSGFALGVSSFLLQKITQNKLADTAVMGFGNFNLIPISIMVILTNFAQDETSNLMSISTLNIITPFVIIATSLGLCLLFYWSSKDLGKYNLKKLLLSGIILNFVSLAIAFSIIAFANPNAKIVIERKIVGYISNGIDDVNFYVSITCVMISFIVLLINASKINIFIANQLLAKSLGIRINRIMILLMICIGLNVGASYSMSGDFVFVGLFAGNLAARIGKSNFQKGLISSGLIGSLMILITYFIFFNLININNAIIAPLIPLIISPYFIYQIATWKVQ